MTHPRTAGLFGATERAGVSWPQVGLAAVLALCLLPVAANEAAWARDYQDVGLAGDYYVTTWQPGRDVLDGVNPWPPPDSPTLAGTGLNYPPPLFVAAAPLSALPFTAARVCWLALVVAALVAAAWALRLSDPRVLAVLLFSAPVVSGLLWANPTLLMIAAAAIVWRWRDHALRAGVVLGLGVAMKFLLAPVVVFLVVTRRYRAASAATVTALVTLTGAWAVLGFEGLREYPRLLRTASEAWVDRGLLVSSLVAQVGPASAAIVAGQVVTLALLAAAWRYRALDAVAYAFALAAVMVASPFAHIYNLGFAAVALAIAVPRFSWPWLLVPLLWFVANWGPLERGYWGDFDQIALATTVTGAVLGAAVAASLRHGPHDDRNPVTLARCRSERPVR